MLQTNITLHVCIFLFLAALLNCQPKLKQVFIPQYLKDLYEIYSVGGLSDEYEEADFGEEVSCLLPTYARKINQKFVYNYKFDGCKTLADIDKIVKVEFLLYKTGTKLTRRQRTDTSFTRIDVKIESESYKNRVTFLTSTSGYGWMALDVKKIFKELLKHRRIEKSYFKLVVDVFESTKNKDQNNVKFSTTTKKKRRALLVVYSKSLVFKLDHSKSLNNVTQSKNGTISRSRRNSELKNVCSSKNTPKNMYPSGCHLETQYLNLMELLPHLSHLLYTQCIEVNKCTGSCLLPHGKNSIESTTHAQMMRSFIHRANRETKNVGKLCCSPKHYKAIPYLIWQEQSIIMRKFKDGKAVSCYCP